MIRAVANLALCIAALSAPAVTLADSEWPMSVGSMQPPHYFGDVRDVRVCFFPTHGCLCNGLPAPCRYHASLSTARRLSAACSTVL